MQPPASDAGPSNGGPSTPTRGRQPIHTPSNVREISKPRLLRAVVKRNNIDSLKSLLATYKATTVEKERAVLFGWLKKFCAYVAANLTPENVLDYSEMTGISARSEEEKGILKKLVRNICSTLSQGEFLEEDYAIALCRSLIYVRPAIYGGGAQLMDVAMKLLGCLCERPKLTRENFAEHEATFLALRQTFFQLHETYRNGIPEKEKQQLRTAVANKKRLLELSCDYYPVSFHFEVLRQAVERLELEDASTQFAQARLCMGYGLLMLVYVLHIFRNLVRCDINPEDYKIAYNNAREAVDNMGTRRREWYDSFRDIVVARENALGEEPSFEPLENACNAAIQKQRELRQRSDQKALRYGVIQEIKLLATWSSSDDVRKAAAKKLVELTKGRDTLEGWWFDDADLLHAFVDSACEIYATGESNQEIVEAIQEIQQSCKSPGIEALSAWLGGATIENKLRERRRRETKREGEDVFVKSGRDVGYVPLSTIRSNIEDLKEAYKHDEFAKVSISSISVNSTRMVFIVKVSSLFEQGSLKHVKDMKHHIVMHEEIVERRKTEGEEEPSSQTQGEDEGEGRSANEEEDHAKEHYEKKRKVKTPVFIEDFFKARSFEKGVPKKEIRKVLVYGNPGSGKTCISKLVAHKWALGEIMQEFKAVYLVPFRDLNAKLKGSQDGTLEDVVARMWFKKMNNGERLCDSRTQVDDDLSESTTLLIFDGLDEAGDGAREFLLEAEKRRCKLLVLTRPYNLREIQTRMHLRLECIGFNDQQLEDFVNEELNESEASRLIESLQQNRPLWEMARIPVTACILCSSAKERETANEGQKNLMSMFQMYNDMTEFVWKRFEEKRDASKARKIDIFDDLERIAFEALQAGQILIEERIVRKYAKTTNAPMFFKETGFLLLKLEGQEYQFPHLTFQEYFAARYIARCVRESVPKSEEEKVRGFIDRGKYDEKNALTMFFAMHALAADGQNINAFQDLLSIVDRQPVEVLGMQHFFLRMRVLAATLEEAKVELLESLLKDKKAIEIAECARHLVTSSVENTSVGEIVVENFERCFRVLERFPRILNDAVEGIKEELANEKTLQENEVSKIQFVLKLAKHSSVHINGIVKVLTHETDKVEDRRFPRDIIRRLALVAEEAPHLVGDLVPVLKKGCDDERSDVRESAMAGIGRMVEAAPYLADDLLPILTTACSDKDPRVRRALPEAIGGFVEAAPHLAGNLIQMLDTLYDDKGSRLRKNTMDVAVRIAEALPHRVAELQPILKKGCDDKDRGVRASAMKNVGKVIGTSTGPVEDLLSMMEEGCSDSHFWVRTNVMEAIKMLKLGGSPDLAEKLVKMVGIGCKDRDPEVRKNAMEAVVTVVGGSSRLLNKLMPMLERGCADEDCDVCKTAVDAIGTVIEESPEISGDLVETLKRACAHGYYEVRANAMKTVGRVVWAMPLLVGDLLAALEEGWNDKSSLVRANVMEAIGRVGKAVPSRAEELLPMVTAGCDGEDFDVRRSALEAIGRIAYGEPSLADDLVPLLKTHSTDTDFQIRKNVTEAVGTVIGVSEPHAEDLLEMLDTLSKDKDVRVRMSVMEAIESVIETFPHLADKLLAMIARGCNDENYKVCDIARKILDGLEPKKVIFLTIAYLREYEAGHALLFARNPITLDCPTGGNEAYFVLHATTSQKIWESDKAAIDEYVKCLRNEFEGSFPGLLEHFKTNDE